VGGSNSDTVFYSDRIGYPGAPPPWFASNTEAESVAGGLRFLDWLAFGSRQPLT
jgi:hypothetical protein